MLLQQVAEGQDRGLIRDPVTDQLDARKAAHRGHLDQGLFHGRVAERVPLLQQMDPQHRRQWVRWPAAFLTGLGVVELDQVDQRLPRHNCLHLGQEALALEKLWAREMRNGAYHPRLLKLRLRCGAKVDALGFVAKREHPSYLRLSEVDLIKRLACCRGDRGSNMDYLAHTVGALKKHGIADHGLLYLLEQVQRGKG